jgi:hypothetical protein
VTSKYLWRAALIGVLCVALVARTEATTLSSNVDHAAAGLFAGIAAVVVVAIIVIHESTKKHAITGCVISAQNTLTLTDEKDKYVYTLSGDTSGVKPGERTTLQGKKIKPTGSARLMWETKKIIKDFGACQP